MFEGFECKQLRADLLKLLLRIHGHPSMNAPAPRKCRNQKQNHSFCEQMCEVATTGGDGAITLWNLHSGEHLRTLRRDRPYERLDISGVKGLTQAQKTSLRALGAIESAPVPDIQDAP